MPRPLAGFPDSWGNKRASVFPVTGPTSYSQYTAPTTGGQDVPLHPNAGIKFADFAVGAVSTDGVHRAEVVQIEPSSIGGLTVPRTRLVLKWYVVSTGAEVAAAVNLSTKTVYIFAVGSN